MHPPETPPWTARLGARLSKLSAPVVLVIVVSLLGFALRLEHAITFDGPTRGSDYRVYVQGVEWMLQHRRPFDFDPTAPYQVRYQPPLWYALGAVILAFARFERAIAGLSIAGWVIRQILLARLLRELVPRHRWSAAIALSIHAFLPLSVLIDGKVLPEGTIATLFMIALYLLCRMERQASAGTGILVRTATLFGLFTGLAVLTKATGAVLLLVAVVTLVFQAGRWARAGQGAAAISRRLLLPALAGAAVFCLVVGWWCGPNLWKYKHPFPHDWDREAKIGAEVEPLFYRRPLGWALPVETSYLSFPIIRSAIDPRPNFWGVVVAGTWADFYNRGFCRLKGGGTTDKVIGAPGGWKGRSWGGPEWAVSLRCVRLFATLVRIGVFLSLAGIFAVLHCAWDHLRSRARRGSLVLPLACALGVLFVFFFALAYPRDDTMVLNPRYLLSTATPMSACFGLTLARLSEARPRWGWLAHSLSFVAVLAVGALVVLERFGH